MSIQLRLTVMNFMRFFGWGSWLISLGAYMIVTLGFTGGQVGSIYATMGPPCYPTRWPFIASWANLARQPDSEGQGRTPVLTPGR
jgi:hypothetical protein